MKRLVVILLATVLTSIPLSGSDIESVTYTRLVSSISQPNSPVVSGKYVIFTARETRAMPESRSDMKTTQPFIHSSG